MITLEKLLTYKKDSLIDAAETLEATDIGQLVEWLSEKDDTIRYFSLLLLQYRAQEHDDVYSYWDIFRGKLKSENSYQRSIGLMLIAENAKWDTEHRLDEMIDLYLSFCDDEKPITVRQCIQNICKIVPYKKHLYSKIVDKLISIDISERKETQRKILLIDIITVLASIRKLEPCEAIEFYICNAMTGGILDKKAKKQIEEILNT